MSASREGEREQVEPLVDLLIDERALAWWQLQPQPDGLFARAEHLPVWRAWDVLPRDAVAVRRRLREHDVRRATELIGGAAERVSARLQLALALRKRMDGGCSLGT